MDKLYNDKGEVAVVVSHGFGAGWSTWSDVDPMDKQYNELIVNKDWDKLYKLCEKNSVYAGGLEDCSIHWLKPGTKFIISEYDGAEGLELLEETPWQTA